MSLPLNNEVSTKIGIITVSDTRTRETDKSGNKIEEILTANNHAVIERIIVKDEPEAIIQAIRSLTEKADFIITNGGTGISSRDVTYETVLPLLDKEITGFGELFRFLSYQEIGTRSILSRSTAGLIGDTTVFVLPGSTNAVKLALNEIILKEIPHLYSEKQKHNG